ncbi:MAG TPA: hypothetical protein VM659_28730 [Dongiaceae bacterium]|nr:hypothetical protein [Dongiaceae bacterium]
MMRIQAFASGRISRVHTFLDNSGEPCIQVSAGSADAYLWLGVDDALQLIKILSDAVVTAQALKPEVAA